MIIIQLLMFNNSLIFKLEEKIIVLIYERLNPWKLKLSRESFAKIMGGEIE
jgi:ABC-type phosphate transport system substrate-binding protein